MYVFYVSNFTKFIRKSSKLFNLNNYFVWCKIIFKYDVLNKAARYLEVF